MRSLSVSTRLNRDGLEQVRQRVEASTLIDVVDRAREHLRQLAVYDRCEPTGSR
jgi:hypothetical protein